MDKELKTRDQVEEKYTWNLKDMYADTAAFEKDLELVKEMVSEITKYEGKVCDSAENLLKVLDLNAKASQKINFALDYACRKFDEDQGNGNNQALSQKAFSLYVDAASKTAFINPEILQMDEEKLSGFMKESEGLKLYDKYIKEIKRLKAHTLSTEIEKISAMTGEMKQSPNEIYESFTNVDMTFPTVKDENGMDTQITNGKFVPMEMSSDRRLRKDVFEGYYAEFKKYANTIAQMYSAEVKTRIFNSRLRGYSSNLEAAVDANDVSPEVYMNLLKTVDANVDKFHHYVSLRKKCLKVGELHMYDIYTPMIKDAAVTVTYEEAQKMILEALSVLGDDYTALLKEAFENRWCDVYENKGKRGGAYSAGAYGCHPYMLLNYTDTLDDMFTVAHEMGHSMHSYFSNSTQPYIYSQYKIFVAEVASTTNELLLLDYLLKNCKDKKEKAYLLNHYLDSFKGTVYRQTQFAEFEMRTNEMLEKGEALTADALCKLYKEINEKYYGPSMISDDEISYEWARIPHFYYNFYVYQYATSFCAACAISERILKEGAPYVAQYKKFLSSGCTDSPVNLLKIAGVDLTTAKPIEDALNKFDSLITELEELV